MEEYKKAEGEVRLSKSKTDKDILYEVELEHNSVTFSHDGEGSRVLVIDKDPFPASAAEYEAVSQLRALRAAKTAAFLSVITRRSGWVLIDRAGYGVLFHRLGDLVAMRSPHFVYEPHLEVFYQICQERKIIESDTFGEKFAEYSRMELGQGEVELRNQLLSDVQMALQSDWFRKALAGRRKAAKRTARAFNEIYRRAFAKRSRLLIVRVDLEYALRGNHKEFHPLHSPEVQDRFLPEVFLSDRDRFINNLRDNQLPGRFAENLLEWGWKLECGRQRGWHLHAVFFFDASLVKSDWYMATMLGELWERLTEGRGAYFNVNQHQREYQRRFIGEIHRGDQEAEMAYQKYVDYISKDDQVPVVKTSKKMQMFGVSRGAGHGK